MDKLSIVITIPEHFHAEDELSNALQDDGIFGDLTSALSAAAADWIYEFLEGVWWADIEVKVERGDGGG